MELPDNFERLFTALSPKDASNHLFPAGFITYYRKNDQQLYYVTADHSLYPINAACQLVSPLLDIAKPKACIVEVSTDNKLVPSYLIDHAKIAADNDCANELLYTVHQAHLRAIPVYGGEPSHAYIFSNFESQRENLASMYMLRQFAFIREHPNMSRLDLNRLDEEFWAKLAQEAAVPEGGHPNFAELKVWMKENIGKEVFYNLDKMDFGPFSEGTKAQQLNYEIGNFRERNLLNIIVSALNNYSVVLVVYGSGHLVKSHKIFEKMFGSVGENISHADHPARPSFSPETLNKPTTIS